MDALQASHVSHLGYDRPTTPFLDKLASQGITFTNAISPASWTVPAYLSVFSSTYPSFHGLTNRYVKYDADNKVLGNIRDQVPHLKPIALILKEYGFKTGGFTGNSGVGSPLGYQLGFDTYTDETKFGGMDNSYQKSIAWLEKLRKTDRFFIFFHGYDSHGQFPLPADYRGTFFDPSLKVSFQGSPKEQEKLRDLGLEGRLPPWKPDDKAFWINWYDSKIRDADSRFEIFYRELERRDLLKKTIFVIFSDHGTELAEHGRLDHGHTLYDELIHVPLLIVPPGLTKARKVQTQVSTLDVLPTVLDLLGIEKTPALKKQIQGRSLAAGLINGAIEGHDVFSETDYRNYTHKRAIRTPDGWKYIMTLEDGTDELYNLREDPGEHKNLVSQKLQVASLLREKLNKHLQSTNAKSKANAKTCLPVYANQCQ